MDQNHQLRQRIHQQIKERVRMYNTCITRTNPPYMAFNYTIDLSEEKGQMVAKIREMTIRGDNAILEYLDGIVKLDKECGQSAK